VLVSVAILGLGLTAILSAQAGAFASAAQARNISVATGLLRCKMTELEEHLYRDGFQETDETGAGPCCEGDENPNMRCTWRVDRPQFPEAKLGDLNLASGLDFSSPGGAGSANPLGAIGLLAGAAPGASPLAGASGVGDIAKVLADANSTAISPGAPPAGAPSGAPGSPPSPDGAGAGMGGLASMAMSFVYPSLKVVFEASTRRITTTLTFRQGNKDYSIDVVEWFCVPQKGLAADDPNAPDPASTAGTPSTAGTVKGGHALPSLPSPSHT
jgi:general secretion pathway protein I